MMLRVLTYHRVADPVATPLLNPSLVSALPGVFEQQARHLARRYSAVSMEEVLDAVLCGRKLPRRAVLITFDDAYRDFGDIAWPILRRYRLPAALFVPTGFANQPAQQFWWDRLYQAISLTSANAFALQKLGTIPLSTNEQRRRGLQRVQGHVKTLPQDAAASLIDWICEQLGSPQQIARSVHTWDELRSLARDGVALCSHSRTHPILPHLFSDQIRQELRESQHDLEREIGNALPVFCYPAGAFNNTVMRLLGEEGFRIAFTTMDGHNDPATSEPLCLRRTNITPRTSLSIFRLRLHKWAGYGDRLRHGRLGWQVSGA